MLTYEFTEPVRTQITLFWFSSCST